MPQCRSPWPSFFRSASSPASSSPPASCRAGSSTSVPSSPSGPWPPPCWPPTTRTRQGPGCAGVTWPSSRPGARPDSPSPPSASAGCPAAKATEPTGRLTEISRRPAGIWVTPLSHADRSSAPAVRPRHRRQAAHCPDLVQRGRTPRRWPCQGRDRLVSGRVPIAEVVMQLRSAPGLRKAFGDKTVLDGIDLDVPAGTVFSLLGPNGAGKTTTVNVLTTLMKADGGTVRVAGHDVATETKAVRAAIGVTGQFAAVDELLTGRENLQLMVDLNRVPAGDGSRISTELLERFDLTESAQKLVSTYSGGMRRRLDLAMTLVGSPRIIFLDEPTTGLDPRSRRTMWSIIRELVADGVTVFLTTQYLDEADQLADRVAVLDGGRLVADDRSEERRVGE